MTAYDEGNFAGAEQYYRTLKKASAPSSKLFYNIGNCLYQQGKYAQALASYESALRISPRDSDILENLNLTRRKLFLPEKNLLEAPSDVPPYLRDLLRPDEWLLVLSIGAALVFLSLGLRRSMSRPVWCAVLASGGVVMAAAFAAVLAQSVSSYDDRAAIVVVRSAPVYALPSTQALRLPDINLQPGEEVRIVETRLDWVRIRAGAAEGWVRKNDVSETLGSLTGNPISSCRRRTPSGGASAARNLFFLSLLLIFIFGCKLHFVTVIRFEMKEFHL